MERNIALLLIGWGLFGLFVWPDFIFWLFRFLICRTRSVKELQAVLASLGTLTTRNLMEPDSRAYQHWLGLMRREIIKASDLRALCYYHALAYIHGDAEDYLEHLCTHYMVQLGQKAIEGESDPAKLSAIGKVLPGTEETDCLHRQIEQKLNLELK